MSRFNWFQDPPNQFSNDARMPAALLGMLAPNYCTPIPGSALLHAACSEPPIAAVGLGVGTLASYARPFQRIDFFELDPAIVRLSVPEKPGSEFFTFVSDARKRGAEISMTTGDARQQLSRAAADGYYRFNFVDAFNSDSVPWHLLTVEAVQLYTKKLRPDGVIAFHTSNRHVDLANALANVARNLKLAGVRVHDNPTHWRNDEDDDARFGSEWVFLAERASTLKNLPNPQPAAGPKNGWNEGMKIYANAPDGKSVWTDDFTDPEPYMRDSMNSINVSRWILTSLVVLLLLVLLIEAIMGLVAVASEGLVTKDESNEEDEEIVTIVPLKQPTRRKPPDNFPEDRERIRE